MKRIICLLSIHDWGFKFDDGRADAVTWSSGMKVWMGDIKVKCNSCGYVKRADSVIHHQLPEYMPAELVS